MKVITILNKYLFRKDLYYKIREKITWFKRLLFKDAFKDQKKLIGDINDIIIFDVGSHIGETIHKYKTIFPSSKIYAFEPTESSIQKLFSKFGNDENINLSNFALSNENSNKPFYLSKNENLNSLKNPNNRAWGFEKNEKTQVSTTTIDSFCLKNDIQHIDILKIDTQGSELDILQGSQSLLNKGSISLIFIEWQVVPLYENHVLYYEIGSYLAQFGYEYFNIYNINEARSGQIRWGDAIFTGKDIRNNLIQKYGRGTGSGW